MLLPAVWSFSSQEEDMKELRKLLMACGEETDRETANRIFDLVRTEEEEQKRFGFSFLKGKGENERKDKKQP